MRLDPDLNELRLILLRLHPHLAVDEAHKPLHTIQDSLNLYSNSSSPRLFVSVLANPRLIESSGVQLFFLFLR